MIQEVKQICLALCLDEMSILYTFYRYFRTALIYISLFPKMNQIKLINKNNLFIPSNTVSSCFILFNKKINLKYIKTSITKIYPPLPTSVQPISITKTLLIVLTKNERDPPLFTGKLLIKFQNILRNTTQVIIRHRVKILFSVISSPITLERQK